jgi:regulator of RNase E activity RraA
MNYEKLKEFSTCDCSDALATLKEPIGNLINIQMVCAGGKVVGPAYTAEFNKISSSTKCKTNHVDFAPSGSVLVIKQPKDTPNAVWGGLMTARAIQVGVIGAVIDGRVRDVNEINEFGFPVWAVGRSTMGAAPICHLSTVGQDLLIGDEYPVIVKTGDIIMADEHGAVCIPERLVDSVYESCCKRVAIDEKCMQDLKKGYTIVETFAKYR